MSNVGYLVDDVSELSFMDESFGLVFLVTVLGDIVDRSAFLHEAYRVKKGEFYRSMSIIQTLFFDRPIGVAG